LKLKHYTTAINTIFILYTMVYMSGRHVFDLVGHPQALQEHRSKGCLDFLHYAIPTAYKFQ